MIKLTTENASQGLDMLLGYHSHHAAHLYLPAPDGAVSKELQDAGIKTLKDLLVHHLVNQTVPSQQTLDNLAFVKKQAPKNITDSTGIQSTSQTQDDIKVVENWLKASAYAMFVVLDLMSLGESLDDLSDDAFEKLGNRHKNHAASLFEKGLADLGKKGGVVTQAKTLFGALVKAFKFGLFQDVMHAATASWDAWDYIKESVIAIVQILAWFATDGIAAVAEFVEKLVDTCEDIEGLSDAIDALTVGDSSTYDSAVAAATVLESPIQLHTPSVIEFYNDIYIGTYYKGYNSIVVVTSDPETIINNRAELSKIKNSLQKREEAKAASDKATQYPVWKDRQVLCFIDGNGAVHPAVGSPTSFIIDNKLAFAILTADPADPQVKGAKKDLRGEVYYMCSDYGAVWGPAKKLGTIGDACCGVAINQVSDYLVCASVQSDTRHIKNCTYGKDGVWTTEQPTNSYCSAATTPGVTQNDGDGIGITILFMGTGDGHIWMTECNASEGWQDPVKPNNGWTTTGTPVPMPDNNVWGGVYYLSSDLSDPAFYVGQRWPGPNWSGISKFDSVKAAGSPALLGNYLYYQDLALNLQAVDLSDAKPIG